MTTDKLKLVIIGSGPAGFTAAIYAARAGLSPVLYQGNEPGGQLMNTTKVENYPGFPDGILGPDMMTQFHKHAENVGTQVRFGTVTSVDLSTTPYKLQINNNKNIYSDTIIISTGAVAKWLGLESEKKLIGKGVSSCAICDGFFFKQQQVAVVGGGDSAAEQALYLAKICSQVTVLVRTGNMKASIIMQNRLKKTHNIKIIFNTTVTQVIGEKEVEAIKLKNSENNTNTQIKVKGLFIAIGHKPNTDIFKQYLDIDPQGYIKTIPGTSKTNLPGVFAAGDVQDPIYRQAVTSAGSGCIAALDAERFLSTIDT